MPLIAGSSSRDLLLPVTQALGGSTFLEMARGPPVGKLLKAFILTFTRDPMLDAASTSLHHDKAGQDPGAEARRDFYATFDSICSKVLDRDAERKLARIFETTILHAIYTHGVAWDGKNKRRVLARVAEIAKAADRRSTHKHVGEQELAKAADQVICEARGHCTDVAARMKGQVFALVWCTGYPVDCAEMAQDGPSEQLGRHAA